MFNIFSIYEYLKKTFSRKDFLIVLAVMTVYFITRLIEIESFPIFGDEGIYVNWAKTAWQDAAWRFISLTDGRQPLQTWGTIPFLKITAPNYLLGGRLFAVATGFFSLVGLGILLFYLWGKRASLTGMILYIFTPYFLFYDRMALMDSGVNAAFIWMLFFSILLIREKRLDIALIFGLGAGLASLSKSTVRLFFLTSFFAPVLIWTRKSLNEKRIKFIKDSFNYYMLFGLACFVAFAIYNVQRLSQFFHYVSGKNNTFIMTFEQFFDTPFKYLGQNLVNIPVFFSWEMGFIIPLLGVAGFLYLYKQDKNLFTYFLIWFAVPYIVISFFAIVLFPRYVIYLGTIFLITATYYLSSIKVKQLQTYIILISLSVLPLLYTIWFDHANIPFPEIDRGQYIEGWPAGWGAKEVMDFAKEQSKEKTVLLIVEGTFGMSGDVFNVLKGDDPNIMVQGEWPLNKESLEEHRDKFKGKKVYVVFSHRTEFPEDWPIEKIKVYDRPGDKARIALFEVIEY